MFSVFWSIHKLVIGNHCKKNYSCIFYGNTIMYFFTENKLLLIDKYETALQNGQMVPILVPEDAQKPMEFITSTTARRAVGVKTYNPFVFGNTGKILGFIQFDNTKNKSFKIGSKNVDTLTVFFIFVVISG